MSASRRTGAWRSPSDPAPAGKKGVRRSGGATPRTRKESAPGPAPFFLRRSGKIAGARQGSEPNRGLIHAATARRPSGSRFEPFAALPNTPFRSHPPFVKRYDRTRRPARPGRCEPERSASLNSSPSLPGGGPSEGRWREIPSQHFPSTTALRAAVPLAEASSGRNAMANRRRGTWTRAAPGSRKAPPTEPRLFPKSLWCRNAAG